MTSTTTIRHRADRNAMLAALGRAVGHEGTAVMGVRLLDAEVDLLVAADEAEHTRRMTAQVGAFDNWDVLRVLTCLPRWEPVPIRSLTKEERQTVRSAPRGAVEIADGSVTRQAGPPVTRVLAVVTDTEWERGLNVASRFAPVATRVLVLTGGTAELAVVAAEAGEYGIGLAVRTGSHVRFVVQPELWSEHYFSPGSWLFREQAYRAFRNQAALIPSAVLTTRG